jgi:hypothetical protein
MRPSILWMVLAACGPKAAPPAAPAPAPVAASPATDVAAKSNGQVPEALRDILRFEVKPSGREFGAFDAIAPAGWPYDKDTSSYSPHLDQLPPFNNRLGYSSVRVHTSCSGPCADKDWAALVQSLVQELVDKGYAIESDTTPSEGRRVVVSAHPDKRIHSYFFWQAGGHRYFVCEAEVDGLLAQATSAFQTACDGLVIHDWK